VEQVPQRDTGNAYARWNDADDHAAENMMVAKHVLAALRLLGAPPVLVHVPNNLIRHLARKFGMPKMTRFPL
jgi:hypothetical protein